MALNELFEDVKLRAQVAPGDVMSRNSLWQIFAARGEFDRARTQLDALALLDATWALDVLACQALPARYPQPSGDELLLGRTTVWQQLEGEAYLGFGQKTLVTDAMRYSVAGEAGIFFSKSAKP